MEVEALTEETSNRRSEKRFTQTEAIAIKILFASGNPELLGRSLAGTTVDVSASGLQLTLKEQLEVKSTIDVNETLRKDFKQYFLSGKVRWCRAVEDSNYCVGIALHEIPGEETDYKAWREALNH